MVFTIQLRHILRRHKGFGLRIMYKTTSPRPYIAILALLLCILSCTVAPLPAESLNATTYKVGSVTHKVGTSPATIAVTVKAWAVNIRALDGVPTSESAKQGDTVYGYASGEWFILVSAGREWGKVWLGCLNIESSYGCEAE